MKILFNIAHPGQVHLFKNAIWTLEEKGHECKITIIDKDVSLRLLDAYGIKYDVVGSAKPTLFSKATELLKIEYNLYKIARKFKPDILVGGVGNAYVAHVGKLIRKPSIVFDDTEHAKIERFLTDPFATVICTPSCFKKNLGKKQVKYNGYHDLAYLHLNNFSPNPSVLQEIGLTEDEKFIVVRLVSWGASHDVGQHGIKGKIEFIEELEIYGRVLITSEANLDPYFEKYKIKISPEKLHDLLYYATLYIGEGGTTASEAAVLGTHAVHISTTAKHCGIFSDLNKYELMWTFDDESGVMNLIKQLLEIKNLWDEGKEKRDKMIQDKIDVTDFMVWFIENYPDSFKDVKNNYEFIDQSISGDSK